MNLISNPSFETDLSDWINWTGGLTFTRDTTEHAYGVASAKCVTPGGSPAEGVSAHPQVEASAEYTFAISVKAPAGTEMLVEVDAYSSVDSTVYISSPIFETFTADGTWQLIERTFTTPVGTVSLDTGIYTGTAAAQAVTYYLDGALLVEGDHAPAFDEPSVTFQVAFASQPGDATYDWTTVPGSMDITYGRGAPNEYGQPETGQSDIELSDAASDMDPANADGAYYPNVKRNKPTRALLTINGVNYPLFQHFIERLPRAQRVGSSWTRRTVLGVDAFGGFALASLRTLVFPGGGDPPIITGVSYSSETSGARWESVLDTINWDAARRNIDTGNSTLAAYTTGDDTNVKALTHLLDVVTNENGLGFMDAEGNARFIERHAFITDTTVLATFADDESIEEGSWPTAIRYTELQPESTDVVNDYTGSREGGSIMTSSDEPSIDDYGQRSESLSFLLTTDNDVQDALDWKLSRTKNPLERIDGIKVMPGLDADKWVTLLGLEVGSRVSVVEWPPGYAAPVEREFIIRHLAVHLPTALSGAEFTFQLTPVEADAWLVLDDPSVGKLDTGKLAY